MPSLAPLGAEESIFSNIDSLNAEFVPKFLPYREQEQKIIAQTIKPLCEGKCCRNLLIFGKAGIGKTHAVKRVLEDVLSETDNVRGAFVNCWVDSSTLGILGKIAFDLGFNVRNGMTPTELLQRIKARAEEKSIVFVFDEIDKAEDQGFLYSVLEEVTERAIIAITNSKEWLALLDERIRSRFLPQELEFRPYSKAEISGIMRERRKFAFYQETWSPEAISLVDEKTFELSDVRAGIQLMREAGLVAEEKASRIVQLEHVEKALEKLFP